MDPSNFYPDPGGKKLNYRIPNFSSLLEKFAKLYVSKVPIPLRGSTNNLTLAKTSRPHCTFENSCPHPPSLSRGHYFDVFPQMAADEKKKEQAGQPRKPISMSISKRW